MLDSTVYEVMLDSGGTIDVAVHCMPATYKVHIAEHTSLFFFFTSRSISSSFTGRCALSLKSGERDIISAFRIVTVGAVASVTRFRAIVSLP
jgi:hypothetical protein